MTSTEVSLIRKHVYAGFQPGNIWLPQGMCTRCAVDIHVLDRQLSEERELRCNTSNEMGDKEVASTKKKISLKLPDDYMCDIPIKTRSKIETNCYCRWCKLARLNGLQFKQWQQGLKKWVTTSITYICSCCGKGVASLNTGSHTCSAADQARVKAMVQSIPREMKGKLAVALIRDQISKQSNSSTGSISLIDANGGNPVQVTVGTMSNRDEIKPITLREAQTISSKAHLTGRQQ